MSNLNFIDIFCGAGGFSNGLEKAGHKCVLGIDHNKHALETFKLNHLNAQIFCGDISLLSNQLIKQMLAKTPIGLIVGGPPCQGFSTVGKGDPDDLRNKLFLEYFRIVKLIKPEIIIIENVTGILAKKNEAILKMIFKKFKSIGYNLNCNILSADDYGVPSRRRRTIIIGNCINKQNQFPPKKSQKILTGEALRNLNNKIKNHDLNAAKIKNQLDLDRIKFIPQGKGIRYQSDEEKYLPKKLFFNVNWQKLRENRFRQTKYQRLDRKSVAPTILTHRHCYYHPSQNRFLTVREAARLQSFPDNFIFLGPITSQWRQIGNAVPPMLSYHLGLSVKKIFKSKKEKVDNHKSKRNNINEEVSKIRENAFTY